MEMTTILQKLLYNHLTGVIQNFPCFKMFQLQLKVINKNVCSQLIFTCSKSIIEALDRGLKYV